MAQEKVSSKGLADMMTNAKNSGDLAEKSDKIVKSPEMVSPPGSIGGKSETPPAPPAQEAAPALPKPEPVQATPPPQAPAAQSSGASKGKQISAAASNVIQGNFGAKTQGAAKGPQTMGVAKAPQGIDSQSMGPKTMGVAKASTMEVQKGPSQAEPSSNVIAFDPAKPRKNWQDKAHENFGAKKLQGGKFPAHNDPILAGVGMLLEHKQSHGETHQMAA